MSEPDTTDIVYRLKRNAESEDCFNDPYSDVLLDAAEEITRLRAALAEAERDAARYIFACAKGLILINGLPANVGYSKNRGDAAIDAAMARENEE